MPIKDPNYSMVPMPVTDAIRHVMQCLRNHAHSTHKGEHQSSDGTAGITPGAFDPNAIMGITIKDGLITALISLDISSASFSRASTAHDRVTGAEVESDVPRWEDGPWAGYQAILPEEGTTNLLTANQASVETDTTGFLALNSAVLTRVTDEYWHGAASLRVVTPGAVASEGFYTSPYTAVTQSLPYTASVWLKGTGSVKLRIREYDASNVVIGSTETDTITLTNNWTRYSITRLFGATGVKASLHVITISTQAITFYADGLQIEQKLYATSWQLPGAARAAESPTISMAGMSPSLCTIEGFVYIDEMTRRQDGVNANRIFSAPRASGTAAGIELFHQGASANWTLYTQDDGGAITQANLSDAVTPDGWYYYCVSATAAVAKAQFYRWATKELVGTITINNPKLPSAFYSVMYVGHRWDKTRYVNALHACIRISSIDRSGETPDLTKPLPVDENTVGAWRLNGSLAGLRNGITQTFNPNTITSITVENGLITAIS